MLTAIELTCLEYRDAAKAIVWANQDTPEFTRLAWQTYRTTGEFLSVDGKPFAAPKFFTRRPKA